MKLVMLGLWSRPLEGETARSYLLRGHSASLLRLGGG